jgi:two-component system chemotaxis response regulator CheB
MEAVVIGASAGALEALSSILPVLPADFPLPIFMVIHLPPDRKSVMADVLNAKCKVRVVEVEDKEPIVAGKVYLAPPDYHLLVESKAELSLSSEDPVHYSRPAIDVLFETAADCYRQGLVGIVLTGANEDGAAGLKAIVLAGGVGIVQHPELAAVPTMPAAALAACPQAKRMSLDEIATYLKALAGVV